MKKIIFILCTALCLPFISCSNDDALDEALTRGEQIENDYKKSLNHACEVLNDNEFPSENKYNTDLLVGTWKRTDITAEIYIDGEKTNDTWCFDWSKQEVQHSIESRPEYEIIIINKDKTFVLQDKNEKTINLPGEKWDYIYNHIVTFSTSYTIEEIYEFKKLLFPLRFANGKLTRENTYLTTLYYEVLDLTEDKLILKMETLEQPVLDGWYYEHFYEDKSGTHCFIIETLERK